MQLTIRDWRPTNNRQYFSPIDEADVATYPAYPACPICDTADAAVPALEIGESDWKATVKLVHCSGCTHVYYLNPPSAESIEAFYRSSWNTQTGESLDNDVIVKTGTFDKIARRLAEAGITDKGVRILDVGCGFGELLGGLEKEGYGNFAGCELQPYRLASVSKRFPGRIFESDFASQREERYDVIYSNHVMEHVSFPQKMFDFKLRHLSENGIIVINVPDAKFEPPFYQLLGLSHLHSFTVKSLRELGRKFGFDCRFFRNGRADELSAVFFRDPAHIADAAENAFFTEEELDLPSCDDQVERLRQAWLPASGQREKTFNLLFAPYTARKSIPGDRQHPELAGIRAPIYRLVCRAYHWLSYERKWPRLANLLWHANKLLSGSDCDLRGFGYVLVERGDGAGGTPRVSWRGQGIFQVK